MCAYSRQFIFKNFYMHIFNQYYARIQGYSYNYAHIQDNLYMHTFKEIYTRTYSRQFIYATKKFPDILFLFIQVVVLDLSSSEMA